MSDKRCIIMRGASGAGKNYWIDEHVPQSATIASADQFFVTHGEYKFDLALLPQAHNSCLLMFLAAIQRNDPIIVVNNTNTRVYEIAPFYRLAEAHGYAVEIVWVIATHEACMARNQHGTPPETIKVMISGVDTLPPWWNVRVVLNDEKITIGDIT